MKMSNKVYDVLKWFVAIVIPAIIGLYTTLASIWAWPHADQIIGTMAGVEIFLGTILQISSAQYKKKTTN